MDAYFAGGCFWCMEKPYHLIDGVTLAESGYCGGDEVDPTYEAVKAQQTAHRETVHIVFDPAVVSFGELLSVYLDSIDPYDVGGQFIDRGRSYTCAVYYTDEAQRAESAAAIAALEAAVGKKACIAVEPFKKFYRAEEYHQDYARRHPEAYAEEMEISGRLKKI